MNLKSTTNQQELTHERLGLDGIANMATTNKTSNAHVPNIMLSMNENYFKIQTERKLLLFELI